MTPLKKNHGYNSIRTGNYHIYLGCHHGMYVFFRPFGVTLFRLTDKEVDLCFNESSCSGLAEKVDLDEAPDLDAPFII